MKVKNLLNRLIISTPNFMKYTFYKVYDFFAYPKNRKKVIKGKGFINETFYIIRPRNNTVEGLMSLLLNVVRQLAYAEKKNYIPICDFSELKTQYLGINNKHNIWEDYFVQNYKLNNIYDGTKIIFGNLNPTRTSFLDFDNWTSIVQINESRRLINKYIGINSDIISKLNKELKNININKTLGLYIRGTDYVQLKPVGHPKQPELNEIYQKVDEFLNKYNVENIFLVTEDALIYKQIKEHYRKLVKIASFDSFVTNYYGKDFLSNDASINELSDNYYLRGANYLVKVLILSKLSYLIGGKTNGTWAAMSFSKGYKDYYIFELGNY